MRKLLPGFCCPELSAREGVIKTAEGERLIALAVRFEEWLGNLLNEVDGEAEEKIRFRCTRSSCGCGVKVSVCCFRENYRLQYAYS
jgi:hypothetical protein